MEKGVTLKDRKVVNLYQPFDNFYLRHVLNPARLAYLFSPKSRFIPVYSFFALFNKNVLLKILEILSIPSVLKRGFEYPYLDPYWQSLLNFLYKHKVITSPTVMVTIIPNDEPKITSVSLHATLTSSMTDGFIGSKKGWLGHGVSTDYHEAVSKMFGEFLERYFLSKYKNDDLLKSSVLSLVKKSKKFVHPNIFGGYSEYQKELIPEISYTEESIFQWMEVEDIVLKEKVLFPAQLIYWNYRIFKNESILRLPNTNGAAGGFSREEATLSGIYEIIQRDAFFIFWLNKIPPPRINHATIQNKAIQKIFEGLGRYGLEGYILNTTADINIFSCVFILIDRNKGVAAVTMGGGCGMNIVDAIIRAYTEALSVRYWLIRTNSTYTLRPGYRHFIDPVSQEERMRLWGNSFMKGKIEWFISGVMQELETLATPPRLGSKAEELEYVLMAILRAVGDAKFYVHEVKDRILKKIGFTVVKIVIPQLIPLYLVERYGPVAMERVSVACKKIGYTPSIKVNEIPHPFP